MAAVPFFAFPAALIAYYEGWGFIAAVCVIVAFAGVVIGWTS